MDGPLVTIGLTCFNAGETIARAVASALAQDWPRIELVVVDDHSMDQSVEIVNNAIAGDSRARVVCHGRNAGPAGARNTVLAEAKGEFIAFFDDDDESFPRRISTQLETLQAYETRTGVTLAVCYAGGVRRYPNGYTQDLPAIGSRGDEVPNGPGLADYLLFYRKRPDWFYGSGVPACALMARASTFAALDGFDVQLRRVQDVDLAIRLALKGGHFVGTEERLFVQYATDGSDKTPEKKLEGEQRLAEKSETYLRSISRYYYARHWPRLRYWHFKRRYGRFLLELLGLLLRHPIAVTVHLLSTGPQRLRHERRMRMKGGA